MHFIPRSAWAAPANRPRVEHSRRERLVLHHTVTIDRDETPLFWESLGEILTHQRRLATLRPDLLDPVDVPYQMVGYLTPADGLVVVEGIGLDCIGAHVGGLNTTSWGLAMAGDFERYPLDPLRTEQLEQEFAALARLLNDLAGHPVPWEPHQKHKPTACPGRSLLPLVGAQP